MGSLGRANELREKLGEMKTTLNGLDFTIKMAYGLLAQDPKQEAFSVWCCLRDANDQLRRELGEAEKILIRLKGEAVLEVIFPETDGAN